MATNQSSVSLNASRILNTVGVAPKPQWHGVYLASCVQNNDPLGQQRIKMYVPQVLGTAVSNWARPLGYGTIALPQVGQMVHAIFAGGDVNHPVYICVNMDTINTDISSAINSIQPGNWQPLTLLNSWVNMTGYLPAQVRIITPGVVQIVGHIQNGNPADGTPISALPAGFYHSGSAQAFTANIISGSNNFFISGQVNGNTDIGHLTDGTIGGVTDTEGLTNGQIAGTSGQVNGGSAGSTNHTHSNGSYAVNNGQHSHFGNQNGGTLAVQDGSHSHTLGSMSVSTPVDYNSPVMTVSSTGVMTISNCNPAATNLSFSSTLVV